MRRSKIEELIRKKIEVERMRQTMAKEREIIENIKTIFGISVIKEGDCYFWYQDNPKSQLSSWLESYSGVKLPDNKTYCKVNGSIESFYLSLVASTIKEVKELKEEINKLKNKNTNTKTYTKPSVSTGTVTTPHYYTETYGVKGSLEE